MEEKKLEKVLNDRVGEQIIQDAKKK